MKALWAPFEVTSLPSSVAFYTALGLRTLETFHEGGLAGRGVTGGLAGRGVTGGLAGGGVSGGVTGVVFEAGPGGRIEVVAPRTPSPPPPVALEFPTWAEVDAAYERVGGDAPPVVFPRGHYGFVARDPDGNPLLIWSEK